MFLLYIGCDVTCDKLDIQVFPINIDPGTLGTVVIVLANTMFSILVMCTGC